MGRYYWSSKQVTEDLKRVTIPFLKKNGYLNQEWKSGGINWSRNREEIGNIGIQSTIDERWCYVRFSYSQINRDTNEKKEFDYQVQLVTTPCNYGGVRYWFKCPLSIKGQYCGKRIGILYKGGDYFGCRHCYNLTYESRNLSGIFKATGKTISEPELGELHNKIRCKYYAGKMRKRYKKWLIKSRRSSAQVLFIVNHLSGGTFLDSLT